MSLKGVILAGGTASRLFPLTKVTNKHLLPVGRIPMIYYPVARLLEGGVRDILVITSPDHMGEIVNLLGSGTPLGAEFTYRVQDQPGGIAQALGLAQAFVGGEGCVVILGDNIYTTTLAPSIQAFNADPSGARIILKRVPDPGRYGVAELSADGKTVVAIEEKPDAPKSDYAVTGTYMYDAKIFEIIATLKPSGRGELEITDVNNHYIHEGQMQWSEFSGDWTDAGTFPSLHYANKLVQNLAVPEIITPIMSRE